MIVGLQITKNTKKYKKLISFLDTKKLDSVQFIHIKNNKELKKNFHLLNILVTYKITPKLFQYRSSNLKWIHIGASGIEENLFDDLLKSKVMLTNSKGINAQPVAEFIISQVLYFSKRITDCNQFKLNKTWSQWEIAKQIKLLENCTLGIIGYGEIGKKLSKLAKAFGMKVFATRRLQKKTEHKKNVDYLLPLNQLNTLLKESDYVCITCPLTPLTHGMINKDSFKIMKKESILINTSRGSVVNEQDLIQALLDEKIAGASLDVFSQEPLDKKNPLFNINNVFLSPHISGNFSQYQEQMMIQFNDMLIKFINQKTLKNRVCKKRLY